MGRVGPPRPPNRALGAGLSLFRHISLVRRWSLTEVAKPRSHRAERRRAVPRGAPPAYSDLAPVRSVVHRQRPRAARSRPRPRTRPRTPPGDPPRFPPPAGGRVSEGGAYTVPSSRTASGSSAFAGVLSTIRFTTPANA